MRKVLVERNELASGIQRASEPEGQKLS